METKLSLFIVICCVALLLASCAVASGKQTEPSAAKSDPSEATISDSTAGQTEPSENLIPTTWPYFYFSKPSAPSTVAGSTATTTVSETTPETVYRPYADYFDYDATYRPTYEDVMQLSRKMPITEIVEHIGKPHSIGPGSGSISVQWQMADGRICEIDLALPEGAPNDPPGVPGILTYGVAVVIRIRN